MKPKLFSLLGSSLLAASFTNANAQTIWTGDVDNHWTNGGNWNPSGVPGTGADVVFDGSGGNLNTVFDGTSFTLDSLTFTSGQTNSVSIATTNDHPLFLGPESGPGPFTVLDVQEGSHSFIGSAGSLEDRDLIFRGQAGTRFDVNVDDGAVFEIAGRMFNAGSGSDFNRNFVKTGGGFLIFSANNGGSQAWRIDDDGSFEVEEGVLRFAAQNAAGFSRNNYTVSTAFSFEGVVRDEIVGHSGPHS